MNTPLKAKRTLLAAGLILILTTIAYADSFHASFHFDDKRQIVKNEYIRDMGNLPRFFTDAGLASYIVGEKGYRPVTLSSFALNYRVSGYRVWGWHLFNLLLHVINALLVYAVVKAVFNRKGGYNSDATPLIVALVFAVHPIQTGAVTYISGRAVLLAAFFYLSAFYAFLCFRARGRFRYLWAAALPALYLLGLLSKEMAVSLPLLFMAYDTAFTYRDGLRRRDVFYAAAPYVPLAGVLASYLLIKKALQGFAAAPFYSYGVGEYLMSEAKVVLMYLRLLVLPVNQNADYDMAATRSFDYMVMASALVFAATSFYLVRNGRSRPAIAFFGLWFLIALAPESSFIPITDIAVEHRLYLPSIGFFAAVVMAVQSTLRKQAIRRAALASVIVFLCMSTFSRNRVWATDTTLWSDAARKSPGSIRAHANLGMAYTVDRRYEDAERELRRAIELDPYYYQIFNVYNNLGVCYMETGRYAEAIDAFSKAIVVNPGYAESRCNIGVTYYKMGRYAEAADALAGAVSLDPGYSVAHMELGLSLTRLGRHREALSEMEEAARYSPQDFDTRYNLAVVCENNGMFARALEEADTALGFAEDASQKKDAESLIAELKGKV